MINLKSFIKKNAENIIFIVLCIFSILFLLNAETRFCKTFKTAGHSFFSVFQLGMSGVQSVFSNSIKSIGESKRLREENLQLQQRMQDYLKSKNENIELHNELSKLKSQLEIFDSVSSIYDKNVKLIAVEIIAKQPGNFYSTFIINKGKKHGIREKMAVVALYHNYQGLVGKTLIVGNATSIVMPIFNSDFFIAARFQSSYYEGLVNGIGENSMELIMRYVQKQAKAEIKYGELVITSGMSEIFPKGIHIGTVKAIESKTYETSMEITIEPVIDFSKLEYVFIVDNRGSDG